MAKGHEVYILLHPGFPHEKAGIVPGIKVITFESRTVIPQMIQSENA